MNATYNASIFWTVLFWFCNASLLIIFSIFASWSSCACVKNLLQRCCLKKVLGQTPSQNSRAALLTETLLFALIFEILPERTTEPRANKFFAMNSWE